MRTLIASIRYNLGNLAHFSGRARLGQFWPYAIAVVVLAFAVTGVFMVAAMAEGFTEVARILAQASDEAKPVAPEAMMGIFDFGSAFVANALANLAAILLLAAAVARRLHDSDRHGAWGLLPLPFLIAGTALVPPMLEEVTTAAFTGPSPLYFLVVLNNLLFYAALIWLIYLLVAQGTPGPNRFGPPPEDR